MGIGQSIIIILKINCEHINIYFKQITQFNFIPLPVSHGNVKRLL